MKFTDMLDEYLIARKELQEARDSYSGYSFGYFHDKLIQREDNAAKVLNEAFEKALDGK